MKLNERIMVYYATSSSPADNTGFLYKKSERSTAYHKRWFVLKGNILFYFEDKDSREPAGAIVLEGCTVELCESTEEYAFAIKFECAKSRPYVLAANSQATMESWVKALSRANFDYMRLVVRELQKQLEELQQAITVGFVAQERFVCHKRKPLFNLEITPEATEHETREQAVKSYTPAKENGCAVWNNTDPVPNGHVLPATRDLHTLPLSGSEENTNPPPLPPRRRRKADNPCGAAETKLNGPDSPGTVSFSKLHDWFGKEIVELRRQWLERQLKPEQ